MYLVDKSVELAEGLDNSKNIVEQFISLATFTPTDVMYSQAIPNADGSLITPREWQSRTYEEVLIRVKKIAAYLESIGVMPGDKIAIISNTRPEWLEADIAVLMLGGVVVSVYQSLIAEDIAYILADSETKYVFAENEEQVRKLVEIESTEMTVEATEDRAEQKLQLSFKKIICFEDLDSSNSVACLSEILKSDYPLCSGSLEQIDRDVLASLVYTSGTTGPPKGVMQTHGNHLSNVRQVVVSGILVDKSDVMLFLPMAHSFAKLIAYLGVMAGVEIKFPAVADKKTSASNPFSITKDIREGSAKVVPVVPRLLEKMQAGVEAQAMAGGIKGFLISKTLKIKKDAGLLYLIFQPLREKIRNTLFGPNYVYALSGGAKLNDSTWKFFEDLEMPICQGYGLTETCVATNVNRLETRRVGTVGRVLDKDIELKLSEEGEILYRGPNISLGYYKRPTATSKSWNDDGWFYTGDLGSIDPEGFLTITGRKKELLVSSNGKNIAPSEIEQKIAESPYVSQVVLFGDGRSYCVALVTLNQAAVEEWAAKNKISLSSEIDKDEDVFKLVQSHISTVNKELSSFEQAKKFTVIPEEFTVDNGLLTPTFKIKRKLVEDRYSIEIDAMYRK